MSKESFMITQPYNDSLTANNNNNNSNEKWGQQKRTWRKPPEIPTGKYKIGNKITHPIISYFNKLSKLLPYLRKHV